MQVSIHIYVCMFNLDMFFQHIYIYTYIHVFTVWLAFGQPQQVLEPGDLLCPWSGFGASGKI